MKNIRLVVIIYCLSVSLAYSQKAKVNSAFNQMISGQMDEAKRLIDEAVENESTKSSVKAWYYRGLIYHSLYKDVKFGNLCDHCLEKAYEYYMHAIDLDPKDDLVDSMRLTQLPILAVSLFGSGVDEFKSKNYSVALSQFELVHKIIPEDTSAILNAAYSADRAGNIEKAKLYYSQLISMKYHDENIYLSLSNFYRQEKDFDHAVEVLHQGMIEFPGNMPMMVAEINILLLQGKNEEATQSLNSAIAKDSGNANLYLALGSTYDNMANPKDADGKELAKPSNHEELVVKSTDAYKKGLAIDSANYELNFNLGAIYFNKAAELVNESNKIKSDAEYQKAKLRYEDKFKEAQPYLEKALKNNPRKTDDDLNLYDGTLRSLKQLYAKTNQTEKYNQLTKLNEAK